MERLPANAADVVRLGVDTIVATGTNPITVAAMKATTTIPIDDYQCRSGQCRTCRQSGATGRERHRV
jgi:hypothetical protein